tara:strand:+ start:85 stop:516 length:432 start_codon:yes stop_codon:yes gene_type:complete
MLLGVGYSQCNESNMEEYYPNLQGCNLEGADLTNVPLSLIDLSGANLQGANLTGVTIAETNLSGANLLNASIWDTNFYLSNLCNLAGSPSGDVCEQPDVITDSNGDGYDDVSYEAGAISGDSNLDGTLNVQDVVYFIDVILNP